MAYRAPGEPKHREQPADWVRRLEAHMEIGQPQLLLIEATGGELVASIPLAPGSARLGKMVSATSVSWQPHIDERTESRTYWLDFELRVPIQVRSRGMEVAFAMRPEDGVGTDGWRTTEPR